MIRLISSCSSFEVSFICNKAEINFADEPSNQNVLAFFN